MMTNGTAANNSLFSSNNDPFGSAAMTNNKSVAADPFDAFSNPAATTGTTGAMKMSNTSNFDDLWSKNNTAVNNATFDPFGASSLPASNSTMGFGVDDNWMNSLNNNNAANANATNNNNNNWATGFNDEGT